MDLSQKLGMGIEPISVVDIANYALFYVATFFLFFEALSINSGPTRIIG